VNHLEQIKKILKEAKLPSHVSDAIITEPNGIVMIATTDPDTFDPEPVFSKRVFKTIETSNVIFTFNDEGILYCIDAISEYY
jgi:hypothetical protein